MANCNKLFLDFDVNLNIPPTKKDKLKKSKDEIRTKIKNYFKTNHPDYRPEFYIQGSYKVGTTILTKDNECDLDDGVYFRREQGVSGTTLQTWIKNAVENHTTTPPEHRKKCVRVIFKAEYHIDIPVYYFPDDSEHPLLAIKNEDCSESDPKEFVVWYKNEINNTPQVLRISRYLKAWGDNKRDKMPSGLAMSILAANNIQENDRDDLALRDTLEKIKEVLDNSFECIVPANPNDDLFKDYDQTRIDKFNNNLDLFIKDANKAVEEKNQLKSSKFWKNNLGDKFPEGADEDTDAKEKTLNILKQSILSGNAYAQKSGDITENNKGVKHQEHKNFGEEKI
jgi:hypothetical protein